MLRLVRAAIIAVALIAPLFAFAQAPAVRTVILTGQTSSCAQSATFLARTSGLSVSDKQAYNQFICGLVDDGIFSTLGALYVLGAPNQAASLLNLISTSFSLTINGIPTFTAYRGWVPVTPVTDFLALGANMNTAGIQCVQNSCTLGVYSNTNNTAAGGRSEDMGDANTIIAVGRTDNVSGGIYLRPVDTTSVDSSTAPTPYYPGYAAWVRSAAAVFSAYAQGANIAAESGTAASTAVGTGAINIFKVGVVGSANQLFGAHLGSQLTASQMASFSARWHKLAAAFGAFH